MDLFVEDPEEGRVQEKLTGGRVLIGGDDSYEVCGPGAAAAEEEGVANGDEKDSHDKVAELVAVLV